MRVTIKDHRTCGHKNGSIALETSLAGEGARVAAFPYDSSIPGDKQRAIDLARASADVLLCNPDVAETKAAEQPSIADDALRVVQRFVRSNEPERATAALELYKQLRAGRL